MKTSKLLTFLGLLLGIVCLSNTNSSQAQISERVNIYYESNDELTLRKASVPLGTPGTSYRYEQTFGITNTAYIEDTTHLNYPGSLYIDASNNVYVSDTGSRVLGFDSSGQVVFSVGKAGYSNTSQTTLWWGGETVKDPSEYIWVNDYCRIVQFDQNGDFQQSIPADDNRPYECGMDNDRFRTVGGNAIVGNLLFVSDIENHRVQIYTLDGVNPPVYVNTLGVTDESGNDNTHFNYPGSLDVDSSGQLYVLDSGNERIQQCSTSDNWVNWSCSTFRSGYGALDGLDIDNNDSIYFINNPNNRVIKIESGITETVVINDLYTWAKDIAVDSSGNIFIADWPASTIRKYSAAGEFQSIFAGVEFVPYLTTSPYLNRPYGITVDTEGNLYIGELGGYRLVKMNPAGEYVWTIGSAGNWGGWDQQRFGSYWGGLEGSPAVTSSGELYVSDRTNHYILIFDTTDGSYINTFGSYGQGNYEFNEPMGVAINPINGDILIVDSANHRIQVFSNTWVYKTTIGETGVSGTDNQHFNRPYGVALTGDGTVFVADGENTRIQKCIYSTPPTYSCTTFIGIVQEGGGDFSHLYPKSVAVDQEGRVFATDWENRRVQVFNSNGAYLTTIGGTWGETTGRFRWVGGITVDAQGNLYVADEINHRVQKFALGVPDWQQVNINGFGEKLSGGIIALEVFNKQIYASEANWGQGARIWSSANGTNWTASTEPGFGETYGSANPAVPDMIVFNNHLYAGTGWAGNPLQIWRTSNGENWEQVEDSGFGIVENTAVEAFEVFANQIYAAVQNTSTGAQIWRSNTGDSGSWEQVKEGFNDDPVSYRSTGMAVYHNKLYVVVENDSTGTEIWETPDGNSWLQINNDGFGTPNNWVQGGLVVYKGELYIGTNNLATGGQIWKYNGTTWSQIVADGFGDTNLESLLVFGDDLYTGSGNVESGMKIWRLSGGSPEKINTNGFGDSNNESSLWCNAQTVFNGHMYWGTWNWANGGEVWRYDKGYFPTFIPLLTK